MAALGLVVLPVGAAFAWGRTTHLGIGATLLDDAPPEVPMKPLSRRQKIRWLSLSIGLAVALTFSARHLIDFSDVGVVVIWIIAMLLLTAAVRRFFADNSGEDGRLEQEKKLRKFLERIFGTKRKP
ncbi:MAG TPA: hypothetical protein VNU21_10500 [Usitatibacter sp.]|nr:hypothetical protein [Usitatibacter sp.]